MYSQKVLEHFKNPRNVGEMERPDAVGNVAHPLCGDILRLYLRIESGKIKKATFKTLGCSAAIASSSMATVLLQGKTLEEAKKITNEEISEALGGLPPIKIHCSVLAQQAIAAALKDYARHQGGQPRHESARRIKR